MGESRSLRLRWFGVLGEDEEGVLRLRGEEVAEGDLEEESARQGCSNEGWLGGG